MIFARGGVRSLVCIVCMYEPGGRVCPCSTVVFFFPHAFPHFGHIRMYTYVCMNRGEGGGGDNRDQQWHRYGRSFACGRFIWGLLSDLGGFL
jgi:hypothetical protein